MSNSDPVTGQAAWYDLKVDIYPAAPGDSGVYPNFASIKPLPGIDESPKVLRYHTHRPVNLERSLQDALSRGHLNGKEKS